MKEVDEPMSSLTSNHKPLSHMTSHKPLSHMESITEMRAIRNDSEVSKAKGRKTVLP